MKRDMDVVRKMVLALRDANEPISGISDINEHQFAYHAQLLEEAGLVRAALSPDTGKAMARKAILHRLTWDGQDFADAILDDTVWKRAKENVLKPAGSWTFSVLLEYLKYEIKRRIPGLEMP